MVCRRGGWGHWIGSALGELANLHFELTIEPRAGIPCSMHGSICLSLYSFVITHQYLSEYVHGFISAEPQAKSNAHVRAAQHCTCFLDFVRLRTVPCTLCRACSWPVRFYSKEIVHFLYTDRQASVVPVDRVVR